MPEPAAQLLKEISALLERLAASDGATAGPHWGAMHKLLLKAKVDPALLLRIVGMRDLTQLQRTVARLRGEPVSEEPAATNEVDQHTSNRPAEIDAAILHDALRVFRKRLRLTQLDAESRLGVGPMSGGSDQRIQAMTPPREFPIAVWEALVRAGKLRREGDGFYSIVTD